MYTKIDILHNVLSKKECRTLIKYGNGFIKNDVLGNLRPTGFRTNFNCNLYHGTHKLIDKLGSVIIDNYNVDDSQLERCFYNYYREGEKVRNHFDYFSDLKDRPVDAGGQRLYTIILSLNDDYVGGETGFPQLNEKFKGHAGDLLVFKTFNSIGVLDENTLHCAYPVLKGSKYNIVFFIRESKILNHNYYS